MKVKIEFNLPEEREDLFHALNGLKSLLVIDRLLEYIRSQIKYTEPITQTNHETLEILRSNILELLDEYDINIDSLLS